MKNQPEALRLADALDQEDCMMSAKDICEAAAELRRLHHNNQVLNNALWRACGDDYRAIEAALAEPEPGFWGRVAARQSDKIKQLETALAALESPVEESTTDWEAVAADQAMTIALMKGGAGGRKKSVTPQP
jgi:hypothetical protein